MDGFLVGLVVGVAGVIIITLLFRLRKRSRSKSSVSGPSIESFITSMRAVGELSVFRIMTKEVITASDHWLGEFGKKYLTWLLSEKQITLIIEFDVDFRYDLNDPVFRVERSGATNYRMVMPPCKHDVLIRDMRIHSEGKTELLPWLMPDLLGRFFTGGFSVEAKNKLIQETRQEASRFAGALVEKATAEAQASAARTLKMLAQGLGTWHVDFEFLPATEFRPAIDTSPLEAAVELTGTIEADSQD